MAITRFMRGPFKSAIPCFAQPQAYVYLLCWASTPYKHSKHYLGSAVDLDRRLEQHRAGNGSRLVQVITQAGISFEVARIWRFDTCEEARAFEAVLKRRQHNKRECNICNGLPLDGYASLKQGHWPFHLFPQGKRRPMHTH